MKYVSTRGKAPELEFEDVLLSGMADDGGLYVPAEWPALSAKDIAALWGLPFNEVALKVMRPYVGDALDDGDLARLVADAYATFDHAAVTPLVELDSDLWLLELFHGPTLAFKDVALQLLGRLLDLVLTRRGQRMTVVGATSGDTGSAAIDAIKNRDALDIVILHPDKRVSEVQRRQMTTVDAPNVHNVAIQGTFDDCQSLVKAMFGDRAFRARINMGAVNSINWVRVMAQAVYYFYAAVALGAPERRIAFAVPTGNFGDVFAGHVARRMGLPMDKLIIATNINDILVRTLSTGRYEPRDVQPTSSPAMDIQVSSNFERLLFDAYGRDGTVVARLMADLSAGGGFDVAPATLARIKGEFDAARVDEELTRATIKSVYEATGRLIDPHTAVGIAAAKAKRPWRHAPVVVLATAHPAKFPDEVYAATGVRPTPPAALLDLSARPERCTVLPNNLDAVKDHILSRNRTGA